MIQHQNTSSKREMEVRPRGRQMENRWLSLVFEFQGAGEMLNIFLQKRDVTASMIRGVA
jgi:hypothetical protein